MSQIHLYTTFYPEKKQARLKELHTCLGNNLNNEAIASITVFNEDGDLNAFTQEHLKKVVVRQRPTYQDFINYINAKSSPDDIHIIANTDIYFDKHIAVLEHLDLSNTVLALSRWDTTESKRPILYNRNDSQDAWIFKGKINKKLLADFPLGVPRCDNRLLYELRTADYEVLNPAFSIKAYHIHKGQRTLVYTEEDNFYQIAPPYRYLYPHNLFGLWKTLYYNFMNDKKLGAYRYDIKKINFWWVIRLTRKLLELLTRKQMPLIGYK